MNVARAAPDGYTMLVSALSVFAILPSMRKVEFDPVADFKPVARLAEASRVFAIHPKIRANTLAEFVSYAKQRSRAAELRLIGRRICGAYSHGVVPPRGRHRVAACAVPRCAVGDCMI